MEFLEKTGPTSFLCGQVLSDKVITMKGLIYKGKDVKESMSKERYDPVV